MKAVKSNMKDQILTNDSKILHCPVCDMEWSGNAGDYWDYSDDHIFVCKDCDCEMELVDKITAVKYI